MKVTVEGTAEELLDFAELLAFDRDSRRARDVPKHISSAARAIHAGDDVPNRDREEGVQ